jgi:membrane-associated phospholipid phosphatase
MRELLRSLLPHEIAFALLLGALWLWLVIAAGPFQAQTLIVLALLAAELAVVGFTRTRSSVTAWRVRLGFFLLLINLTYPSLGIVVPALREARVDGLLQRIDTQLFGAPLPLYLDGATRPLTSDLLSACYFVLFPYIFFSCLRHLWKAREELAVSQRFYSGFFTVYAISFAGYVLFPAQGAYLDIPNAFHHALEGDWMTRFNDTIVRRGSNRVDVFPSLHVAASAFILFFDRTYARKRYLVYLAPAIGLWISTIYLRYHYGIDVIAGFAVMVIGLVVSKRWGAIQ